jgi:hypothetical protein
MNPDNYTKQIQDKLIADLAGLQYSNGDNLLAEVVALDIVVPTGRPYGVVMPTSFTIEQNGISYDTRQESFYIGVIFPVEAEETNTCAKSKIDILTEIKGRILRYLEKMPDILNWNLPNIEIYNVRPTRGGIELSQSEAGISLILNINVIFDINIANNQSL